MSEDIGTKSIILNEIEKAPEPILREILDFILFLKSKDRMDTAIASESSLKKDWLVKEEDLAWKGL